MPVVVEPDSLIVSDLLAAMPAGAHGIESAESLHAWLHSHPEEYVVVLGPNVELTEAAAICQHVTATRPTASVVLVREELSTELLKNAMTAGVRDVVVLDNGAALHNAVVRAYDLHVALRGPAGAVRTGKVVSVFSPKGGVGKTTVAVNLALALNERGARRVCLVDLDLAFGDVAITLQVFPTHSIEQAIGAEESLDAEMLDALLTRHQESLMVLAAPSHPDTRERITPQLVARIIHTLKESFDYVVVDLAPSFDEQVLTALDETDDVVLIATLDVPTLKNVKVAIDTLDVLHVAEGRRQLLLNRADEEVGITPEKVEGILAMKVTAEIGTSVDIAAATNAGTPIISHKPGHQASGAIRTLAEAIAGERVLPPGGARAAANDGRGRRFGKKKQR